MEKSNKACQKPRTWFTGQAAEDVQVTTDADQPLVHDTSMCLQPTEESAVIYRADKDGRAKSRKGMVASQLEKPISSTYNDG